MATKKSTRTHESKIDRQLRVLRKQFWSHVPDSDVWSRDPPTVGFTTIPRGLDHVMQIMDDASKGKPPSSTYFTLWCWARDLQVVNVVSAHELALESGFTGQRAESTWRQRMRILENFGFILTEPGRYGPISHVLILHPYRAVQRMNSQGLVQHLRFNALMQTPGRYWRQGPTKGVDHQKLTIN